MLRTSLALYTWDVCSFSSNAFYEMSSNAFSPNGDGINDVWTPTGTGIRRVEMRIYDRWGKVMYQGTGLGAARMLWKASILMS